MKQADFLRSYLPSLPPTFHPDLRNRTPAGEVEGGLEIIQVCNLCWKDQGLGIGPLSDDLGFMICQNKVVNILPEFPVRTLEIWASWEKTHTETDTIFHLAKYIEKNLNFV